MEATITEQQKEANGWLVRIGECLEVLDRVLAGADGRYWNDWDDDCYRAGVHYGWTDGGQHALESWLSSGKTVESNNGTVTVEYDRGTPNSVGAYTIRVVRSRGTKTMVELTVLVEGAEFTGTATERLSLKRLATALDDLGARFNGQHILFTPNHRR